MTHLAVPLRFPARSLRASILGASVCLLLAACDGDPAQTVYEDPLTLGQVSIQLTRAETCDDLLVSIQEGAVAELLQRVQRFRELGEEGNYYGQDSIAVGSTANGSVELPAARESTNSIASGDGDFDNAAPPEPAFAPPAQRDNNGNNSVDEEAGEAQSVEDDAGSNEGFSGTTVQVVDVDEADFVKTDGDRMYVLHGGTLLVLDAWPATDTSLQASAQIEGEPVEMFVYEGKAIVFSRVYENLPAIVAGDSSNESRYDYYGYSSYTKITVLDVSGDGDSPEVVRESYIEGDYTSARRHDEIVRAIVQDGYKVPSLGSPNIEYRDPFGSPYAQQDIDAQLSAWAERMTRAIRSTDLGDWIPRQFSVDDGTLVGSAPDCANYYRPDTGLTASGVTSVVALDLDDLETPLGGATVLGRAERVYANQDALVITQTDYRFEFDENMPAEQTVLHRFDLDGAAIGYTASGAVVGRIHNQFSLDERDGVIRVSTTEQRFNDEDGNATSTVSVRPQAEPMPISGGASMGGASSSLSAGGSAGAAMSGSPSMGIPAPADPDPTSAEEDSLPLPDNVPGEMPEETEKLDTEGSAPLTEPIAAGGPFVPTDAPANGPINRVVTLEVVDNELVQLGATEQFGATESIYATRFMGDRAYVVTFRRTDPLFVLDMSDDADPRVVGELHIPGFSDYLFPVGANHLFAIGRDANEEGGVRGLALQLFDVTDATEPLLIDRYVYGDSTYSPGNVDHRAISFHNDGKTLAFPLQDYQNNQQTLEVFNISTETGLTKMGSVNSANEQTTEECLRNQGYDEEWINQILAEIEEYPEFEQEYAWECNYNREFKRAVFRDDTLFGVSPLGLYTYDLNALDSGALSSTIFPAEIYEYGRYRNEQTDTGEEKPLGATPPRPAFSEPGMAMIPQDFDSDGSENVSDSGESELSDGDSADGSESDNNNDDTEE